MSKFYYDLHIHSCLSPCGDDDMTPANIAGMAFTCGLKIVALTDHNTTKNCRAFFTACHQYGLIPVAGAEITTAEDIHIVALFPTLEQAEAFDSALQSHRILYRNRPEIFGEQRIMDAEDHVLGIDEYLLSNATLLPLEDAVSLAKSFDAAVYPAHIDREANGIIAILGDVPKDLGFTAVEIKDPSLIEQYRQQYSLHGMRIVSDSDAHVLWDVNEAENFLEWEDIDESSEDLIRARLIAYLNGK
ncbi:MAG: PHP domain-containing protein [Clostridia bacterium]|nr:PHP domain-containing protein [Clostridia bacterium]